ncbi:MAG: DUF4350 domain-containing protein [Acidobacteria bacterium]|nr:DUF4350 domain-containing protein [Acidobacteriota bacterium]
MTRAANDLAVLAAIAVLVIGLNLLFLSEAANLEEDELSGDRSSYSSRAYGTKAFFTLLNRSGVQAVRWEDPLTGVSGRRDLSALFSIEPLSEWSEQESAAVAEWVRQGGRLVLIGRPLRWPFPIDSIHLEAKPRRWSVPRILFPSRLTSGLRNVQLTKHAVALELEGGPAIAQIGDTGGVLLLDMRYGDGEIILLGEPYLVANNGISSADNLILARNLVSGLRPGLIAFDEYHHGYSSPGAGQAGSTQAILGLWRYVARTPARFVVVQVALITILGLYSASRRFGRTRPGKRTDRASSHEYISSFAQLLEGMRARSLALDHIYRGLLASARRTTGARGDVLLPENLELMSRRFGVPLDRLRTLFRDCEQALQDDRMTDAQLMYLVAEVRSVESAMGARPR